MAPFNYLHIKRLFDFVGGILFFVICLPIFVLTYFIVLFSMGSPVFFKQERPGLFGTPFTMLKFRTMRKPSIIHNENSDDKRLTNVGKFLRSSSIDEIPTILNVITGDMSFVGPRPLLMEYLNIYSSDQHKRHDVKPGITGLAQVSGRNALNWEEKFDLDLMYVDQMSFALDFRIFLKTIQVVFTRKNINASGYSTMP